MSKTAVESFFLGVSIRITLLVHTIGTVGMLRGYDNKIDQHLVDVRIISSDDTIK